jgi:hypothetical protein
MEDVIALREMAESDSSSDPPHRVTTIRERIRSVSTEAAHSTGRLVPLSGEFCIPSFSCAEFDLITVCFSAHDCYGGVAEGAAHGSGDYAGWLRKIRFKAPPG